MLLIWVDIATVMNLTEFNLMVMSTRQWAKIVTWLRVCPWRGTMVYEDPELEVLELEENSGSVRWKRRPHPETESPKKVKKRDNEEPKYNLKRLYQKPALISITSKVWGNKITQLPINGGDPGDRLKSPSIYQKLINLFYSSPSSQCSSGKLFTYIFKCICHLGSFPF